MSSATNIVSSQAGTIVACPACASTDWQKAGSATNLRYFVCECQNCHLVFSDPMVAADSAWYASSWLYNLRESHHGVQGRDQNVPWNFSQALRELPKTMRGRLLDVGCAEGYFLYLAQLAGYEVTGVDFNPVSLEIARKLLGVSTLYQYSVEELADRLPEMTFDVVTLFEVLEHTANPCQVVETIRGLLKPGGKLLLSVPGRRRWPGLYHPEVDAPPHHLTLWTEEALKELLERAGFRVLGIRSRPLHAEDLGFHLKLRLYGLLRKNRTVNIGGQVEERSDRSVACETAPEKGRSLAFRKLAIATLTPLCWALALNPKAGGFTLFAHCEKK